MFLWLIKLIVLITAPFYFKPKIYYEDKKIQNKNIKGRAIITSNHMFGMDFVLLFYVFYKRYLRCVVSKTLYENKRIYKFLLKKLGAIVVNRNILDISFIKKTIDILDNGGVVEIFPEGTFNQNDELMDFKASCIYFSLKTKTKIIPIYHDGNYGIFKRVRIVIGKPLIFYENNYKITKELINKYTFKLKEKTNELKNILEKKRLT